MSTSPFTIKLSRPLTIFFAWSALLWCLLFPLAKAPANIAAGAVASSLLLSVMTGTRPDLSLLMNKTAIVAMLLLFMPAIWFFHPGSGPFGAYLKDAVFGLFMLAMAFWTRVHSEKINTAIKIVVFATTISATASLLQHFGLLPQKDAGVSLALHNGTLTGAFSLLLVFAASLQTFILRNSVNVKEKCLAGAGLLICIADLFLVVPGRTGYLAFLVMSLFMLYNLFHFNRYLALALFLAVVVFAANSSMIKQRVAAGRTDLQLYSQGVAATSMGARFEMWKVSWRNFTENPVIGAGTNGFGPRWMKEGYSKIPYAFNNPHSTYLHLLGNYGIAGFAVLLFFLWRLAVTAWRFRDTLAGAATGSFLIVFVVGSLTNTMLTGDFYLTWLAIMAGIASGLKIKEIHEAESKDSI